MIPRWSTFYYNLLLHQICHLSVFIVYAIILFCGKKDTRPPSRVFIQSPCPRSLSTYYKNSSCSVILFPPRLQLSVYSLEYMPFRVTSSISPTANTFVVSRKFSWSGDIQFLESAEKLKAMNLNVAMNRMLNVFDEM